MDAADARSSHPPSDHVVEQRGLYADELVVGARYRHRPGRTATELARAAAAALPDLGTEFRLAADTFNAVSYGAQAGTESGYRQIAALDARLSGVPSR